LIVNVLVFEYVTGGGWDDTPLPPALFEEAGYMLSALLRDLLDIPGLSITALRDARWPVPPELESSITWRYVEPSESIQAVWQHSLRHSDAVWPIAPESGGLLERLCHEVESVGKILLNCPARAVRLATSKRNTLDRLARHAIPVVPTRKLKGYRPVFPLVIKPDDGLGCQGIRVLGCDEEWDDTLCAMDISRYVVQPLLSGKSLSLSVLFDRGRAHLLSGNRQIVIRHGHQMQLEAVEVNAFPLTPAHYALAEAIAQAVPELWGYAGIDLLETRRMLKVLEINPRLTTATAGLREALGINLARAIIHLAHQQPFEADLQRTEDRSVTLRWPVA